MACKAFICTLFLLVLLNKSLAQYNRHIPPFQVALTDSSYFSAKQLQKNKALLLIYFSPDCDHCKTFIERLIKNISSVKNVQIVMISYFPLNEIKKFESAYKLSSFKNIKTGTEGYTFKVQKMYNITRFPFVAVFNNKGMLQKTFIEDVPIQSLIKALQ